MGRGRPSFWGRKCGDGAKTLAGICDYSEAFFDMFLLGNESPLMDRPPLKNGIFALDSTVGSV
jgi:hypothetical protein